MAHIIENVLLSDFSDKSMPWKLAEYLKLMSQ